jgi:Spy/CpxP family protein refolding chaperone
MKTKMILVLFAVLLPVMAQPGFRQRGMGPGGPPAGAQAGGPRGGNQLEFLSGYLGLTDAQKTAAKAIFDAAATSSEAARGAAASAHDALEAGIKAKTSDAQLDILAAAVGTAEGKLVAIRAKADVRFRALLTPDQLTKLDTRPTGRPGR